ncbi:hypothetical protein B5X24_HaOG201013 [Helicoverpa armigera]|nr:hypothetical protein B5X24_HaOG201013 [Helicoverpa armigera]
MSQKQEAGLIKLRYTRLEKDMQKIVFSFNLAVNLFLTSKYNLRNNRIYKNGKLYHTFAFFLTLFMNACCIYRMVVLAAAEAHNKNKQLEWSIFIRLMVFYFFNNILGFTTVFILDFVHSENIVLLILEIQSLNRRFRFRDVVQSYIIWNWISLVTIICCNMIRNTIFYISWGYDHVVDQVIDIIMHTLLIALHLNVVIATRIIILLRKYLEEWINIIRTNSHHNNDELCQELFDIYEIILRAYNLFGKIYQFLVRFVLSLKDSTEFCSDQSS